MQIKLTVELPNGRQASFMPDLSDPYWRIELFQQAAPETWAAEFKRTIEHASTHDASLNALRNQLATFQELNEWLISKTLDPNATRKKMAEDFDV